MNIFFLHLNPKTNARLYINKHCVKIILECTQMLYTALWKNNDTSDWISQHEQYLGSNPYKATHYNHPMAKWVRLSLDNYNYTIDIALALCYEYTTRFGKVHKCQPRLEWLQKHPPVSFPKQHIDHHCATLNIPRQCTPIPLAMPKQFYSNDVLYSYRLYYLVEKSALITPKDTFNLRQRIEEWNLYDDVPLSILIKQ